MTNAEMVHTMIAEAQFNKEKSPHGKRQQVLEVAHSELELPQPFSAVPRNETSNLSYLSTRQPKMSKMESKSSKRTSQGKSRQRYGTVGYAISQQPTVQAKYGRELKDIQDMSEAEKISYVDSDNDSDYLMHGLNKDTDGKINHLPKEVQNVVKK